MAGFYKERLYSQILLIIINQPQQKTYLRHVIFYDYSKIAIGNVKN